MANNRETGDCCSKSILLKAQAEYSDRSEERAQGIVQILSRFTDPSKNKLLDLGCGPGSTTMQFGRYARDVVGLDINIVYAKQGRKRQIQMIVADARHIPCRNGVFGIIICNDVLEHVARPEQVIHEILRAMTEDGVAFIQCANKHQIIEPHFLLPFLSWLPSRISNAYLRLSRRGTSYGDYHPLTKREVDLLVRGLNVVHLTRERALTKIKTLDIGSQILRRTISIAGNILSEETLADLAVPFSVHTLLLLKTPQESVDHETFKIL